MNGSEEADYEGGNSAASGCLGIERTPVVGRCWVVLALTVLLAALLRVSTSGAQAASEVSVVDLLVVYTPAASGGAGGAAAIQSQVRQAVVEANSVLQNSLVNARIRLVGLSEIAYQESGSVAKDLDRLRGTNDGFMDEVHALRVQLGADLVCLVTETGDDLWFYGLQGPSAANAFSVIRRPFLTGGYYLPVTLSFNFGCQLERPYADSVGAFPYAYGYSFHGTDGVSYSTVEAFSGQRLPFFSNPGIVFQGTSAGVPVGQPFPADNARVLNVTAPIVAAFRGAANRTLPPTVRLTSPANGAVLSADGPLLCAAQATDADGAVVQVDFLANGALLGSAEKRPFQLQCSNLLAGRYILMAVAVDDAGAQSVSETASVVVRPGNDDFANREAISGEDVLLTNSNEFATSETGEPAPGFGPGYASVWWSWTAPASGYVTVSLHAFAVVNQCNRRLLDVYSGDSLTNLVRVASTLDEQGAPRLQFSVVAGHSYAIATQSSGQPGRWACATGPFTLRVRLSTLSIGAPQDGAQFSMPLDIPVTLVTTGSTEVVVQAGFYADGVLFGSVGQAPWSLVWSNAPLGLHQLEVVATNANGEALPTAPVQINVRPANDDFNARVVLNGTELSVSASNVGATLEPGEEAIGGGHTVWWSWTAPSNGSLTISADTGDFFPGVRVSTGDALSNLTTVVEAGYINIWPTVFPVLGGRTYQIAVDNYDWAPGAFTLDLDFLASPINDYFANRVVLTNASVTVTGTGLGATSDPMVPADSGAVWYTWIAPGCGTLFASLDGSPTTTSATIYTGTSATNLTSAGWMYTGTGRPATTVEVEAGVEYFIAVGAGGPFQLRLEFAGHGSNDNFADRIPLVGLSATNRTSNTEATAEPGEPNHAGNSAGKSLWWTWTAPAKGHVTVSAAGSSFGPSVAVYTGGSLTNLTQVAADWWYSEVSFDTQAGMTYQIAVDGKWWGGDIQQGYIQLSINEVPAPPPPANDNFADRLLVAGPDFTLVATNDSATVEPGEPSHAGCLNHSTWWSWTAPASGIVNITSLGGNPTAALSVYTGASLTVLVAVAALHTGDQQTRFDVTAGTAYQFALDTCVEKGGAASFEILLSTADLLSPTNGAKFVTPGPIALQAGFTEMDGAITNVDFLANGNLIGAAANAPFAFLWTNVAGGTYSLEARATGVDGKYRWSKPVSIRVVPPNDDFANRIAISGNRVNLSLDTYGATREPGEPAKRSSNAGGATVWWTWTPAAGGRVCITELWSTYLAFATLYTGDSVSNLTLVPYEPASDLAPRTLVANVLGGVPYQIAVDGAVAPYYGPDGSLAFNLFFEPRDDSFSSRTLLTGTNATWHSWTYLSTMESGEPNPPGWTRSGGTVWATWVGPADGSVTLALTNGFTLQGNYLAVYGGASLTNLVRAADNRQTDGSYGTELTFRAAAGTAYQICVGNNETDAFYGGVEFYLGLVLTPAPANDGFAQRTVLSGTSAQGSASLASASSEAGERAHAGVSASHSAWWSWTAPESGRVGVAVGNSNQVPCRVAVYTGESLAALTPVATNDPALIPLIARGYYAAESIAFNATAGTTYQLALDSSVSTDVPFTLELALGRAELTAPGNGATVLTPSSLPFSVQVSDLSPVVTQVVFHVVEDVKGELWTGVASQTPFSLVWSNPVPGHYTVVTVASDANGQSSVSAPSRLSVDLLNDDFAQAIALSGVTAGLSGLNIGASTKPGEPVLSGGSGATVWWSWVAPAGGWVTIADVTANHDQSIGPLVAVYLGSSVSNLALVASNSYVAPQPVPRPPAVILAGPSLGFRALAGTNYWIAVGGVSPAQLEINLLLQMAKAEIVEPLDGGKFLSPTNLLVRAEPLDLGGVVKRVDLLDGTNLLASVTNRPFEFLWLSAPLGNHVLTARAVDEFGISSTSAPVNIRVSFGNDDFVNRMLLVGTNVLVPSDNSLATEEAGEASIGGWPTDFAGPIRIPPDPPTDFGAGKTLWWSWVAPGDGLLTLDVSGGTNHPLMSILGGDAITNLSRLAHNGFLHCNRCTGCVKGAREQVMVAVTNGQVCHITLDVIDPAFGGPHQFELRFQPPPDNDNLTGWRSLAGAPLLVPVANRAATGEEGEPNLKGTAPIRSVWYSWTAPRSGRVTLGAASVPSATPAATVSPLDIIIIWPNPCADTWDDPPAPAAFSPFFSVFTGSNLTNLTVVGAGAPVTFEAMAGVTYLVAMDGQNGTMGDGWMQLSLLPRAANDDFAHATILTGVSPAFSGYNTGATRQPGEPLLDGSSQGRSVWWVWTAPANGTVHIGDTWPFYLGVFVGSAVSDLLPIANGYGAVDFYAHAGTTYHLAVADSYGSEGSFDLAVSGLLSPPGIPPGTDVRLPDDRFQFGVGGALGQSYAIQASTNLVDWETLSIDTAMGGQGSFVDEEAVNFPQRFYRVVPLDGLYMGTPLRATLAPAVAGGGFRVRILGEPGQPFRLRASSDLVYWTELTRNWISGDWVDFLDTDAASLPCRFYQATPLP